jgi:hypothetical protein
MDIKNINGAKSMRLQVQEEMKHIPRGGEAQNQLRMYYQPLRMESLGKKAKEPKKSKGQILIESVNAVKKSYPDFVPKYDKEFFKE